MHMTNYDEILQNPHFQKVNTAIKTVADNIALGMYKQPDFIKEVEEHSYNCKRIVKEAEGVLKAIGKENSQKIEVLDKKISHKASLIDLDDLNKELLELTTHRFNLLHMEIIALEKKLLHSRNQFKNYKNNQKALIKNLTKTINDNHNNKITTIIMNKLRQLKLPF